MPKPSKVYPLPGLGHKENCQRPPPGGRETPRLVAWRRLPSSAGEIHRANLESQSRNTEAYPMPSFPQAARAMLVVAALTVGGVELSTQESRPGGTPTPLSRDALDRWIRATSGGATPTSGDTRFLASLSESERQGAFLYRQRCYTCHVSRLSPRAYGPPISRRNVEGRDAAVRQLILDGTERMPAFKYGLEVSQVDLILAYLKRVEP